MEFSSISLGIFGFSAQMNSYGKEKAFFKILTYFAGPMCNLILALILCLFKVKFEFVQVNLLLGFFNLIPIMPLDGGRILKEIIKKYFGYKKANIFMIEFTKLVLVFFSLIYSFAILKLKNISILILIIYLWWLYYIENKKFKTLKRVYEIIEKGIEKK